LRNPELWSRIRKEAQERYEVEAEKNDQRRAAMEKHGLTASETINPRSFEYITASKTHPELIGKRFFEVAETLGIDDYWEAVRKVLLDDEGETFTGGGGVCEEDIITILRYPACAISTDGSTRDMPSTIMRPAHPRNYGTYAKILQHYVREKHLLSLEEAIRKMTSLPASFLGLTNRGIIRPGSC
jgi:N-acyl-D-amino-acid deacylase